MSSRSPAREHSIAIGHGVMCSYSSRTRTRPLLALLRGRTRPVYSNPTALVLAKKGELPVRYSYLVLFLLVHGRVQKYRTRPWTGTGQVRFRARASTESTRCRRLPEVELAHEPVPVRGLKCWRRRVAMRLRARARARTAAVVPAAVRGDARASSQRRRAEEHASEDVCPSIC